MLFRRRRLAAEGNVPVRESVGRRERGRRGGAVAGAARAGAWSLARLVQLIATIVAAILVAGILLVVFDANRDNTIVNAVLDAAKFLAGPFDDMFKPDGHKLQIGINWGIAAAVYLFAGSLIARLLRR